jgi:hypothetical protein
VVTSSKLPASTKPGGDSLFVVLSEFDSGLGAIGLPPV